MLLTAAMCVSVLAACGSETKETAGGETSADSHSTSGDSAGNPEEEKVLRIAFPDTLTTVEVANVTSATMFKRGGRRYVRRWSMQDEDFSSAAKSGNGVAYDRG